MAVPRRLLPLRATLSPLSPSVMSRFLIGKQNLIGYWMLLAIVATGLIAPWPVVQAQDPFGGDDPFGGAGGGDPFGGSVGAESGADVFGGDAFGGAGFGGAAPNNAGAALPTEMSLDDPDPVVRLIRMSPPQTAQQWADALTWTVRIRRWDEAKRLLDVLRQANWNLDQQAELARAGGTRLWTRLRVDEAGLTPEQQQLVRDIHAAPSKLARNPSAIEGWIRGLSSGDAVERRRAQHKLQDGGLESAGRLVNHLLLGDTNVPPGMLAQTLAGFGADGLDALRAACLVRNPEGVARVYEGIVEIDLKLLPSELGSGVTGGILTEAARSQMMSRLSERLTNIPEPAAVRAFINKRFAAAVGDYQQRRANASEFGAWIWRPAADGRTVEYVHGSLREQSLERAAQLAAHRMLLKVSSIDDLVESGTVLLQRAYHRDPQLELGNISHHLLASFDKQMATNSNYWPLVLAKADEWQMHGAALRALQLMTDHAAQGDIPQPVDYLSQLMRDPRPIIRYSALSAIARLDPKTKYAGAELVLETAVELAGLGSGPQALVIGNSPDLRMAAANMLAQQTGQQAVAVATGREALKELNQNDPIEMIVISDRVSDLSLFELMQRLRNSRQGRSLPIAVLTNELYQHELRFVETTPGVVAAPLTRDPAQAQRVLSQLWSTLDTKPLSSDERSELATTAGNFLAKMAEQPDVYSFYPLRDWSTRLLGQANGLNPQGKLSVLSVLGTPDSQHRLIESVGRAGLSTDERMQIARAFGSSVKRFGTLLSSGDVELAYELYNRLGPQDPGTARALGLVLDYIEAQDGKIPWPEGE
jgi:CheY-like chemotaxis protein